MSKKISSILPIIIFLILVIGGAVWWMMIRDEPQAANNMPPDVVEIEAPASTGAVTDVAVYSVKIVSPWSAETHGEAYPAGAHISPPVAITHAQAGALFNTDELATAGFEAMAETGELAGLLAEIEAANQAYEIRTGERFSAPGETQITIAASQESNLLSLVAMLAPSPDWVIAASNIQLFRDGGWIDGQTVQLTAFDAGTDSGEAYTAADVNTDPKMPVSLPKAGQLYEVDRSIGYGQVIITRQQ